MKTCAGIITEQGGILSHAAIVARELKKPCVVGVKGVLEKLRDGDEVEIEDGKINVIARSLEGDEAIPGQQQSNI